MVVVLCCSCSDRQQGTLQQKDDVQEAVTTAGKDMPAPDYTSWVENKSNGLKVEKRIGDITYSALYKPCAYVAMMDIGKKELTAERLKEKVKEYEGMQYFTFKITAPDQGQELLKWKIQSDQEYYSRLEYFSFNMQKDFKLIDGKDTLDCAMYHFERVYGLEPSATFVLAFPLLTQEQAGSGKRSYTDKTIGYTDQVFGGGNIYMTIRGEDLNRLPEIKL